MRNAECTLRNPCHIGDARLQIPAVLLCGDPFGVIMIPSGVKILTPFIGLLKKSSFPGCSKMVRCKAPEILRNEAYPAVRRNDEG